MHSSFRQIKIKLMEEDITQIYLAELMHRSTRYVSQRMTGKRGWALEDIYYLMDLLHIPYEQMHIYFPKSDLRYSKTA